MMALQKTTRSSLVKQVVDQLVQRIETGSWAVGKRIPPEPELVEQLGVSRNTLREAVQALIHNGMLEARQGDGTYVLSSSEFGAAMQRRLQRSTVIEILEVRHGLEREIARLAAARRTDEDLALIREKLAQSQAIRYDAEAYTLADLDFHMAIASATYNGVMIDLYKNMSEALYYSISGTQELVDILETLSNHHIALVEAIRVQDESAAEEAASSLIQVSKTALTQLIKEGSIQI